MLAITQIVFKHQKTERKSSGCWDYSVSVVFHLLAVVFQHIIHNNFKGTQHIWFVWFQHFLRPRGQEMLNAALNNQSRFCNGPQSPQLHIILKKTTKKLSFQLLTANGLGCAAEKGNSVGSSGPSASLSSLEIRPWTRGEGACRLPSSCRCFSSSGVQSDTAVDRL